MSHPLCSPLLPGISLIEGFDASEYPTRFAGEIKNFDTEDLIPPKEARRLDTCWKYTLVSGERRLVCGLADRN